MSGVEASIPVLLWAAGRADLDDETLTARYRKWPLWVTGEALPTLRQLEDFARRTHTAIGYFFLPEPPELQLPVPDYRTVRNAEVGEPSSALLDVIYLCQQRQDWYREYARIQGEEEREYVGSRRPADSAIDVAASIREVLAITEQERRNVRTWTDALRQLIAKAEDAGVLVMASSVVGSNSHRKLSVEEFRGFALVDEYAPLVFINGADSKSAQMFTLAHELAHIWIGASGVSDAGPGNVPGLELERWCNQVAAELLMPMAALRNEHDPNLPIPDEISRLARVFKVSTLVALRRLFDAGYIDESTLWEQYRVEIERIREIDNRGSGGGDFYNTLGARTGKRFAKAVLGNTLEGQTLFLDAFHLLGMRQSATFYAAARELGVLA